MAKIISGNTNIVLDSTPIGDSSSNSIDPINLRTIEDVAVETGDVNYLTVSIGRFNKDGDITIYGDYRQNSVDIPKFNLSNIKTLNNKNALFNFILVLKDGDESEPEVYASNKVYNELIDNYNNNNPIPTNYLINERKIVVIDIKPLKQKIEDMRSLELGINLNTGAGFVEVFRNLFVKSNFEPDGFGSLTANPSVSLVELVKYISWVISKPNPNYDDRLLPADVIGNYKRYLDVDGDEVSADDPSEEVEAPTYLPFQRAGAYDGESLTYIGLPYVWDAQLQKWIIDPTAYDGPGSGNQSSGGGGQSS